MLQVERFELLKGNKGKSAPPCLTLDPVADDLPGVPVLTETLLKMELEIHESTTGSRGFCDAVLGDVGATIQVLRLAGQEYGWGINRPVSVEECIASLGPRLCLNAAASGSLVDGVRQRPNCEMWAHSREVAQCFKLLAEQSPTNISPDQAYLAGLLHVIGALPAILDWRGYGIAGDPARVALKMADWWQLPRFVKEFFCETLMPGYSPEWSTYISVAHHAAKQSCVTCPLSAAPYLS